MKVGTKLEIDAKRFTFPLFSQKGAGESWPQVKVEKWFVMVSTDSQESSQQQGFTFCFSTQSLLQKKLWLWILVVTAKSGGFGGKANRADAHFHSAARGFRRVGLYTLRKSE